MTANINIMLLLASAPAIYMLPGLIKELLLRLKGQSIGFRRIKLATSYILGVWCGYYSFAHSHSMMDFMAVSLLTFLLARFALSGLKG